MKTRLSAWLKALTAPRRGLPVLLSLVLLGAAVGLSDISGVMQRGDRIRPATYLLTLALAAVYLSLKGWQFGRLLTASGLETRSRSRWLAFAIGEISLTLPFGVYAQNYVLQKAQGTHFVDSAASTTMMLALEAAFLVVVLAIVPIPGWPQMRPTFWGLIGASLVLALLAKGSQRLRRKTRQRAQRDDRLGTVAQGLLDFMRRMRAIGQTRVLLHNALITVAYMLALMLAFQRVGSNVSLTPLDLTEALTIYSFGLLIAMSLGGLLSQFGVLELSGAAAAQAWGLGLHDGLSALLWFRLLWTACIWLLSGGVVIALWGELRRLSVEHD